MKLNKEKVGRRTAVLTGGTGYIGKRLNQHLLDAGWDTILVIRSENRFAPQVNGRVANCRFVEYDGTQESLDKLYFQFDSEVVFFHLAAYSGVSGTGCNINKLVDSNIRLGAHLLEFAVKNKYKNFIYAESYWQFDQNGRQCGNTLYAVTKSAFSLLAEFYSKELNIISLVLYDVYGPNDGRGKLINSLIKGIKTQVAIDMTEAQQLHDFVYIEDVAHAFEVAGISLITSCVRDKGSFYRYTVRSMEVRKLKEFVYLLADAVGFPATVRWGTRPYPQHQIMNPWFPEVTRQLPGWNTKFNFYLGIKEIIKNELS